MAVLSSRLLAERIEEGSELLSESDARIGPKFSLATATEIFLPFLILILKTPAYRAEYPQCEKRSNITAQSARG